MWQQLTRGDVANLVLDNEQTVWPAPNGTSASLVVRTRAELRQEVLIASPQVSRVAYRLLTMAGTLKVGDEQAVPTRDASSLANESFELMLTPKGAFLPPKGVPTVAPRLMGWLATVVDDVRAAWPLVPENARAGQRFTALPPINAPKGAHHIELKAEGIVVSARDEHAEVQVLYTLDAEMQLQTQKQRMHGQGSLVVELSRTCGVLTARRDGQVTLARPGYPNQVIKTVATLTRS